MTALPRRPFLATLPRATRLFRARTLQQLDAMATVDLDVALATLWKRIEAAHRMLPQVREVGVEGKLSCIAECARVLEAAAATPVKVSKTQRQAAKFKAELYAREHAAELDFQDARDEADRAQARTDYRAEMQDWRDRSTARSLTDSFRDPPTPEEF